MSSSNPTFSWAPASGGQPASAAWVDYFNEAGKGVGFSPSDIQSCSPDRSNVWAPTFDDGPSENTRLVLDYFRSVGMKTTFWVIGLQVTRYPSALLQAYQEGHQIGIHTYSHQDLTTLSDAQVISELVYGARAIYDVIGHVFVFLFFRNNGSIDDRVRATAAKMGLFPVTWKEDSEDWRYVGTSDMNKVPASFRAWMESGKSNEISLEHDLFYDTVAVVPESMDVLIKAGKNLVTVSECIGAASSSYDNAILQHFFESGQFDSTTAFLPISFARLSSSTNSTITNSTHLFTSSPAITIAQSLTHAMPPEGTGELTAQAMTQTVYRTRTLVGTTFIADTQSVWPLPVPPVVFAIMIVGAVSVALTICVMVSILLAKKRKTKRDARIVTDLSLGESVTRDAVPRAAPITLLSDHQILQVDDEFNRTEPQERVSLIPGNAQTVRKEGSMSISWMDEFNSFNVSAVSMPKFRQTDVKLVDLSTGYDVLRG
ncbi:hypothetical protein CcCBS67573_g08466 [Chytriomyces confervae]|uniref:NodB homology domain-containing protein n=1 Tax=Chytriomyces confervae TaxID=246404 RepID=A0A507EKB9_9FUNG|nr:hypothetical protein CcCBS67573_g08466 [Chytriomyces confervae]